METNQVWLEVGPFQDNSRAATQLEISQAKVEAQQPLAATLAFQSMGLRRPSDEDSLALLSWQAIQEPEKQSQNNTCLELF